MRREERSVWTKLGRDRLCYLLNLRSPVKISEFIIPKITRSCCLRPISPAILIYFFVISPATLIFSARFAPSHLAALFPHDSLNPPGEFLNQRNVVRSRVIYNRET